MNRHLRWTAAAALATAVGVGVATTAVEGAGAAGRPSASPARVLGAKLPPIKHVFVIVLENENYPDTFGHPSTDPYLATTLPSKGALLTQYYGVGHNSNDNYVAMISGQPPNPDNQFDCPSFVNFPAGKLVGNGLEPGKGCVYPTDVSTIANQLSAKGLSWKAYEQDMGNVPSREAAACGHPRVGAVDNTEGAVSGDGYATRHDPFVYFHSIIDKAGYCDAHVVSLGSTTGAMPKGARKGETGLATDLKSAATTPNLSFITPNLCEDGHDFPCKNQKSGASALADIDAFLSTWVPKITGSPAFKDDGLLVVTFDEADDASGDASACCKEVPGPAAPKPGAFGPGGGRVGAVLISKYIKPGTVVSRTSYNHYSLLATMESIFGLARLADARTVPTTFGSPIFNKPAG